jgi:hypothetical protein
MPTAQQLPENSADTEAAEACQQYVRGWTGKRYGMLHVAAPPHVDRQTRGMRELVAATARTSQAEV